MSESGAGESWDGEAAAARTWRLRLDTSMVSRSITSMSVKPVSTRFFSSSHPMPPAPTTSTCNKSANPCEFLKARQTDEGGTERGSAAPPGR